MPFNNSITWIVNEQPATGNPPATPAQTPPSGPANIAIYQVFQNTVQNRNDLDALQLLINTGITGSFKNVVVITASTSAFTFPSAYANFKITAIGGGGGGASYTQSGFTGEGYNGGHTQIFTDIGTITAGGGIGGRGAETFSGTINFAIGDGGEGGQGMLDGTLLTLPHLLYHGGVGEEGTIITSEHEGLALFSGGCGGSSYYGPGSRRDDGSNYGCGGSGDGRSNFAANSYTTEFGGGGGGGGAVVLYDTDGALSGKNVNIVIGSGGLSNFAYNGVGGIVIIEF